MYNIDNSFFKCYSNSINTACRSFAADNVPVQEQIFLFTNLIAGKMLWISILGSILFSGAKFVPSVPEKETEWTIQILL